mmetsp:Transcript_5486/g.12794  ORF Transcript_5486/g.12794 Transcript_5486/m.12794 type:complete len:230 (-) Transcript_5486:64-753(-)
MSSTRPAITANSALTRFASAPMAMPAITSTFACSVAPKRANTTASMCRSAHNAATTIVSAAPGWRSWHVVWRSDATGALRAMMPLLPEPQAEPAISVPPPASALNAKMRSASVEEEEDGEGEEEEDAEEEGEEEEEEEGEEGSAQKRSTARGAGKERRSEEWSREREEATGAGSAQPAEEKEKLNEAREAVEEGTAWRRSSWASTLKVCGRNSAQPHTRHMAENISSTS